MNEDYPVKERFPRPANIPEEDWDEEEGKVIRDVRTHGGKPPHHASHFFQTIWVIAPELNYNKAVGEKLRNDKNWEYNPNTKRWRYKDGQKKCS